MIIYMVSATPLNTDPNNKYFKSEVKAHQYAASLLTDFNEAGNPEEEKDNWRKYIEVYPVEVDE